ncbi:MAG: queuosine precursor transporter [bacterium]
MEKSKANINYFTVVATAFVSFLLISNIAAQKLIPIGPFVFTGGILLFPVSYIFSDILCEVWGYAKSRIIVWTGFAASLFMALFLYLIVKLPPAPGWPFQQEFETTLQLVPRVVIASLIGYLSGEFLNNFVLAKIKVKTKGSKTGFRFIASTFVGQSADTIIFAVIAFYGVIPNDVLITAIWSGYLFKVVYEIIALPITVPLSRWFKRKTGNDVYDTKTNFNPFKFSEK